MTNFSQSVDFSTGYEYMQNIILDSQFASNGTTNFTEVSNTTWQNSDKGWLVGSDSKWSENLLEENVTADNSGAGGLTQVITNNRDNQGLQLVSFDAVHSGDYSNTFRLQIYGINGEFRMGQYNTDNPTSRKTEEPIEYAKLFDTENMATQQFDWKNFSESVNFGEGYEYIAVKFFTRGVKEGEQMAIDNVSIVDVAENTEDSEDGEDGEDILIPVVYDDRVVIKKGISTTIDVLSNDLYSSLEEIQIESFTQPNNGVVTYKNGQFYYVPDSHMVGQDSFEYTIVDELGQKDSGTVEILIQNPTYDIGVNLDGVSYYGPQHAFLDIFKTARDWIPQKKGTFDTKESDLLDLDENGWVKSLPTAEDNVKYDYVTTVMTVEPGSRGRYVVLYEGEGTLVYSDGAELISAEAGKDLIQTVSSGNKVRVSLTQTDPNDTGDYLRNIRIVPEEYADIYETQSFDAQQPEIFNPNYLKHIESFSTLRFMNWMETNNSEQSEWEERATVDDYTYFKSGGVPVEVMVELSNQNDSNPWFTMPHLATDEYVENFARYVKENLNPELDVYVEYSNEVWNQSFQQARWVKEQALSEGITPQDWYSRRTTQVTQIWDNVFAEDKERVLGVMGSWSTKSEYGRDLLDYNWAGEDALSHQEYGIDVIAIAPYFGRYIGKKQNTTKLKTWSQDIDSGVNKLYKEVTEGGLLKNSPEGGALEAVFSDIEEYSDLSKKHDLPLVAYEGGQHLVSQDRNTKVIKLFEEFNDHSSMGEIYEEYLQEWFEIGGGEFVTFSDVRENNKYGSWGLTEVLNQSSPKYDAVTKLANTSV